MTDKLKQATDIIFDRVHRTGEEIKNDLPNWVERVVKNQIWKKAINPSTMQPYTSVGEWLIAHYPMGPGMGQTKHSIGYDEFIALCNDRPELKSVLIEHRPKGKRGGDRRSEDFKHSNRIIEKARKPGTSRLYIEERLQRDHKKIWGEYLKGKYKSARQAAIAAGFMVDSHDPLKRLKSNWTKATAKQRKEFLEWMKTT